MAVRPPHIPIPDPPEKLRQFIVRRYHQLPPIEQTLVQLFSVIYEPISRASFILCLNQLGITDSSGRSFNNQTLKPYIDRLLALEVITQSGNQGPQCNPLLAEIATREAVRAGKFEAMMKAVQKQLPLTERWKGGPVYITSTRQLIREVRLGIYSNDIALINRRLEDYQQYRYSRDEISLDEIFQQVCNNPFDADWFRTLSKPIYESALASILNVSMLTRIPAEDAFTLLYDDWEDPEFETSDLQKVLLLEQLVLRGKLTEAERVLDSFTEPFRSHSSNLRGILAVLRGDIFSAITHYTQALQDLKKATGKRKVYFQSMSGLFFVLALLKAGTPDRLKEAEGYAATARQAKHWLSPIYGVLENLLKVQQGDLGRKELVLAAAPYLSQPSLEILFRALCLYWVDANQAKLLLPEVLKPFYQEVAAAGYHWLAMEAAELIARLQPNSPYAQFATDLRKESGILPLVDLLQPQATWELSLNALINLQKKEAPTPTKPSNNQRLAWFVTLVGSRWILQPREQTLNTKGEWGRGRPIALKRLKNDISEFNYVTEQDRQVCAQIKTFSYNWGKTEYGFNDKAIGFLVGHPLVFWEESATRIEVVKGEPELLVKQGKGDRLTLQFVPELKESNVLVVKESPTRLKVIEVRPEHRRIAEVLGSKNRLEVPTIAKDRVLEAIHAISSIVTVHSDIGGGTENAVEVPADPKPHIHLLPAGSGLRVAMLVRPFAQTGSYYRPGTGGETVIADIDGQKNKNDPRSAAGKTVGKSGNCGLPNVERLPQRRQRMVD